jgi:hypothetical protein
MRVLGGFDRPMVVARLSVMFRRPGEADANHNVVLENLT